MVRGRLPTMHLHIWLFCGGVNVAHHCSANCSLDGAAVAVAVSGSVVFVSMDDGFLSLRLSAVRWPDFRVLAPLAHKISPSEPRMFYSLDMRLYAEVQTPRVLYGFLLAWRAEAHCIEACDQRRRYRANGCVR